MSVIIEHSIEWLLLISVLIFLIYSMMSIKNEKKAFQEEATPTPFHYIELLIPKWWSLKKDTEFEKIYHRADTRYDWFARLSLITKNNKKLEDLLDEYLKNEEIVFDTEAIVETNPRHLFKDSSMEGVTLALRVEGKATEKVINRLYLDIYLFQYKEDAYFFISRSSVLNGIVEGPFFEEMIYLAQGS